MDKKINIEKSGDTSVTITETSTYSYNAKDLISRIRGLELEQRSLIERSQELKQRYEEIGKELKELNDALKVMNNELEVLQ